MSTVYHMMGPGIGHDVMRRLDIAGVFALIVGTMPSFTRFSTAASNAGVHYSWSVQPPQRELCRGQFFFGGPSIRSWDRIIPAVRVLSVGQMHFAVEAIRLLFCQTIVLGRFRLKRQP